MTGAETAALIAALAVSAGTTAYAATQKPHFPDPPELPALPGRPDLAGRERSDALTRQAARRKRAATLLTGVGGAQVSQSNVAKTLLGS